MTQHRRLLSVVVLQQIRDRHQKLSDTMERGRTPPHHAIITAIADMHTVLEAYDTASDRIRGAQRALDGDQP